MKLQHVKYLKSPTPSAGVAGIWTWADILNLRAAPSVLLSPPHALHRILVQLLITNKPRDMSRLLFFSPWLLLISDFSFLRSTG